MSDNGWAGWFLTLSGWPVFLAVVALGALFGVLVSVLLSRVSNRSAVQAMILAALAMALVAFAILGAAAFLTRK